MVSPYTILYYCPHIIAVIFLGFVLVTKMPNKTAFLLRACVALVVATFFAHLNRIFYLYPAYLYFPSGHMTFCLGVSLSLAMIQPWTLSATVPFLLIFAIDLVRYKCHSEADILGAIALVFVVYGLIHWLWRLPKPARLLDGTASSS